MVEVTEGVDLRHIPNSYSIFMRTLLIKTGLHVWQMLLSSRKKKHNISSILFLGYIFDEAMMMMSFEEPC